MPGATWANTSVVDGDRGQTGTDQVAPRAAAVLDVEQFDRHLGPVDQAGPDRHEPALVAEHAYIAPVMAGALHAWVVLEIVALRRATSDRLRRA